MSQLKKKSRDICLHAFAAMSTILSALLHGASATELGIGSEENVHACESRLHQPHLGTLSSQPQNSSRKTFRARIRERGCGFKSSKGILRKEDWVNLRFLRRRVHV